MVYCLLAGVVALVAYQALRAGGTLSAKNVSLNRSHESLRSALDRLANNVRASRNVPVLLNASGASISAGPAAGIKYDRVLGEPYVLDPVTGAGSIATTATSVAVWRSTDAIGLPPIPEPNDVLIIDTPTGAIRGRVASVVADAPGSGRQKITITFASPVGKPLSWAANQPQWARLVRQEAFIVMPNGTKREFRYYPSIEVTTDLSDTSAYTVITDQIGMANGDDAPFLINNVNGDKSIQANLRVQATDHGKWLLSNQTTDFNTVFQMDMSLTSRLRPKNSN